ITRRHFLVDHERRHRIPGLVSLVGGKLTTYRSLAERVVDRALRLLGRPPVPCPTRAVPDQTTLPALEGEAVPAPCALELAAKLARRLVALYGARVKDVLALARGRRELGRPLAPGSAALAAEVAYVVERESARTADDVLSRRLMLLPPSDAERDAVEVFLG